MLTLLEACVCCFTGADLPAVGPELRSFGAEGADRSKIPLVRKRSGAGRGTGHVECRGGADLPAVSPELRSFSAEGAARAVALALAEEHRYT
jgi:hypothetical protein